MDDLRSPRLWITAALAVVIAWASLVLLLSTLVES